MRSSRISRGFSLVELMVAMVLGLVVIGGVISVMLANKRSYRANEGLSQIQEGARTAYELIARDIRQSGGTGCDNAKRLSFALTNSGLWWQTWDGLRGYDDTQTDTAVAYGTTLGTRVAGTDSIHIQGVEGTGYPVNVHTIGTGTISLNNATATSLSNNDVLMICDFDHATVFQSGLYTGGTSTVNYSITGNCSRGLGFPVNCDGGNGNAYPFQRNAFVSRMTAVDWYVGNNDHVDDGGRSLYRQRLLPGGTMTTEEVVAGVSDMQITYGRNGVDTVVKANALLAADWANVNSVFITVTVTSSDINISTDTATNTGRLSRPFTYLVTLRNRVP